MNSSARVQSRELMSLLTCRHLNRIQAMYRANLEYVKHKEINKYLKRVEKLFNSIDVDINTDISHDIDLGLYYDRRICDEIYSIMLYTSAMEIIRKEGSK